MKVANAVVVRLVYLANALTFNGLLHCLTINLCIECQLDWVYDVVVKLLQVDAASVLHDRSSDVLSDVFI